MKQMKRILALLLAAAVMCSAAPAFSAEEGSTLVISNEQEFMRFAENCTRDVWSQGLTAELGADLDFTGRQNITVPYFCGTFDGKGHTIRGLVYEEKGTRVGLFRTLTEDAVVQDLTVQGTVTVQDGSASMVGLIAGENRGLIQNCTARGSVTAQENTGGIAGQNSETGRIEGCRNEAAVLGITNTGGIAGSSQGSISGCLGLGPVNIDEDQKAPQNTGGIAGRSEGLIEGCTSDARVGYPHLGYNVGGIAGLQTGETRGCTGTGTVQGRKDVGGITGQLEPDSSINSAPSPFDRINAGMNAFINQSAAFTDQLAAMADRGSAGGDAIHGSLDAIRQETSDAGRDFSGDLAAIRGQLDDAGDDLKEVLKTLRQAAATYSGQWSDESRALVDSVDARMGDIQSEVDSMLGGLGSDGAALRDISTQMSDSLHQIRQSIHALGQAPELSVEDESAGITGGPGVIADCTAFCIVEGDSNVGGITGTMSVEVRDEPEVTAAFDDVRLLADTTVKLRATVRGCRFEGSAEAKNDCAGGIVGRAEIGAAVDCVAKGTVTAGTEHCGGIAGRTRGSVVNSAALCDLSGQGWLGGIAGLGGDVRGCTAMTRVDSEGEFLGAVAGETDGVLADNIYLLEDLAGVDGVDYAGKAQGLPFEEFSQLERVPADFVQFSYKFVVNGSTVAELPFEYGGDLDADLIPAAPEAGGEYGQWPEFPTRRLRRSMVLEASFDAPPQTLSWGGAVPELLAEGAFTHDSKLLAGEIPPPDTAPGGIPARSWHYQATNSREDTITLRLRAGETKHPLAALWQEEQWVPVEAVQDGSYLVFEAPAEATVLLLEGPVTFPWAAVLSGGAAVLAVVLALVHRRRKKRAAAKQTEPAAE